MKSKRKYVNKFKPKHLSDHEETSKYSKRSIGNRQFVLNKIRTKYVSLKHRYEQAEQKIVCEEQKEELPELIYMTKVIQAHTYAQSTPTLYKSKEDKYIRFRLSAGKSIPTEQVQEQYLENHLPLMEVWSKSRYPRIDKHTSFHSFTNMRWGGNRDFLIDKWKQKYMRGVYNPEAIIKKSLYAYFQRKMEAKKKNIKICFPTDHFSPPCCDSNFQRISRTHNLKSDSKIFARHCSVPYTHIIVNQSKQYLNDVTTLESPPLRYIYKERNIKENSYKKILELEAISLTPASKTISLITKNKIPGLYTIDYEKIVPERKGHQSKARKSEPMLNCKLYYLSSYHKYWLLNRIIEETPYRWYINSSHNSHEDEKQCHGKYK